ncbi:hypothetical protein FHG87_008535, partial [Trinorchestia longiramus]
MKVSSGCARGAVFQVGRVCVEVLTLSAVATAMATGGLWCQCVLVLLFTLPWRLAAGQNDLNSVEAAGEHIHQWLLELHAHNTRHSVLTSQ